MVILDLCDSNFSKRNRNYRVDIFVGDCCFHETPVLEISRGIFDLKHLPGADWNCLLSVTYPKTSVVVNNSGLED